LLENATLLALHSPENATFCFLHLLENTSFLALHSLEKAIGRKGVLMTVGEARYVELQVTTHFSFLRGVSSPEELHAAASLLGLAAIATTDRNSLAGMVRSLDAQRITGTRSIVGCRLDLICGTSLLVYPTDVQAYARLCRLLSLGKGRGGKGACISAFPHEHVIRLSVKAILYSI
jgi:hypothetical protein